MPLIKSKLESFHTYCMTRILFNIMLSNRLISLWLSIMTLDVSLHYSFISTFTIQTIWIFTFCFTKNLRFWPSVGVALNLQALKSSWLNCDRKLPLNVLRDKPWRVWWIPLSRWGKLFSFPTLITWGKVGLVCLVYWNEWIYLNHQRLEFYRRLS